MTQAFRTGGGGDLKVMHRKQFIIANNKFRVTDAMSLGYFFFSVMAVVSLG